MAALVNDGLIGALVTAAPETTARFALGTRINCSDGTSWIYLAIPTSQAITQYACCAVNSTNRAVPVTSTIGLTGRAIAIAQQAVSSDATNVQYMWFLLSNPFGDTTWKVRVAASCAVDAKLATTANAGTLDDTTAGTVLRIDGIVLTDSQPAGSSGSRTFRTSFYPLTWGAV